MSHLFCARDHPRCAHWKKIISEFILYLWTTSKNVEERFFCTWEFKILPDLFAFRPRRKLVSSVGKIFLERDTEFLHADRNLAMKGNFHFYLLSVSFILTIVTNSEIYDTVDDSIKGLIFKVWYLRFFIIQKDLRNLKKQI